MLCIVCELVVAVCTLVELINLRQAIDNGRDMHIEHVRREMALGFLSLFCTVATLVMMASGTENLLRGGQTVWARMSGTLGGTLLHGGGPKIHSEVSTTVGGVPVSGEGTQHELQAVTTGI